jgi:glycosyltransferase involved in cell wall biosynthesis
MDLVADMLLDHLESDYSDVLVATRIRPPLRRRLTRDHITAGKLFNADRFLNRFWDYPRFVKGLKNEFDVFHVIDQSYGQLLHNLPPERTMVTCHDLDTFQCLLAPEKEPRSLLFKRMMKRTLSGFRKAARVTCNSVATRDQLLANDLVSAERAVIVANGVHPACSAQPDPSADAAAAALIGASGEDRLDILHVGSTIPRKRIDVLLRVFANVKQTFPNARLLRVGGDFSDEQLALAVKLNLRDAILVLPHLERNVLAAIYRRAAVVLQPSEREGFGLPVVEALACGTQVFASDLPVLREVGGDAVMYCAVGDIASWSEGVIKFISERRGNPSQWSNQGSERRQRALTQAAKFSWADYAKKTVALYRELL